MSLTLSEKRTAPNTFRKTLTFAGRWGDRVYIVFSFVLLLIIWDAAVAFFKPPSYVLPSPGKVFIALESGIMVDPTSRASFFYHLWETLQGTFYGFVVGSAIGIVLGSVISEFRIVEKMTMPYVVGLQSLPKVALAPLIVIWFGFGPASKIAMAALITFFPVVVNTIAGLASVEPERIELMRSFKASRWKIFRMVKFPSAMTFIFAAFNMAIVYALLGTIVAEFVGAQRGIGVLIMVLGASGDTAGVFSALVVLGVTGIVLNAIFRIVEKRVVFWVYREEVIVTA